MNYSPYGQSNLNPEPQASRVPKLSFTSQDTVFAYASLIIGVFAARTIPVTTNAFGAMLMVFVLFAFAFVYMRFSQIKITKGLIVFAAFVMLLSLGFIMSANNVLRVFLFFFIVVAFLYWYYCAFNLNGSLLLDENCVRHALYSTFVIPTTSIIYIFPAFVIKDKKSSGSKIMKSVLWAIVGLACAIIPTVIIIALLSYDAQFTSLLKNIFKFSPHALLSWIGDIILGFVLAVGIFGVIFGAKRHKQLKSEANKELGALSCHVIPRALMCATLTPVLIVYIIFFISQWDYYVSAFTKTLPDTLTYSEYAREGFFQLCWVCAINALFLLLFNLLIKKTDKNRDVIRSLYSSILSLFTLVLVATALSKMLLYIDFFGLTRKRVYASWLIIVLALFFIAVLCKQFIARMPLIRTLTITFAVCFALIAIPDVDAMIASYNVNEYISGDADYVDVSAISEYDVSAVPALAKLKDELEGRHSLSEDEVLYLAQTNSALLRIKNELENEPNHIFSFNLPTQRARGILSQIEPKANQ